MQKGPISVEAAPGHILEVRTTGGFSAVGEKNGKAIRVLGPDSQSTRFWRHVMTPDIDTIRLEAHKDVWFDWKIVVIKPRQEVPDPTPVELPAGAIKPESIESMIARMIRTEVARSAPSEPETWEEADDFEVGEEDDWQSPYELTELIDEEPIDRSYVEDQVDRKKPMDETPQEDDNSTHIEKPTPEQVSGTAE